MRKFYILFLLTQLQFSSTEVAAFSPNSSAISINQDLECLNRFLPDILRKIPEIKGNYQSVEPMTIGGKSFINDVYSIHTDCEDFVIKLGNKE